jgi:uncharacterized membrane protein YccC
MWFSSLLLRYPTLRRAFNIRANVASVSFLTCSIPSFFLHQITIGLALSLGSIACGLVDTSSVRRYRYQDFAIAIPLFFLIALGTIWVFPYSLMFSVSLAIVSFLLFMLSVYTPRLGAIGFATILLSVYGMLLYHPNQSLWLLPTCLSLGALWYVLWQAIAHWLLPNQESKDILDQIYQDLSLKLAVHCRVLMVNSYGKTRFVEAARYRSRLMTALVTLHQRIDLQYASGEDSQDLSDIERFSEVAERILEQTRLMQFMPSAEFQFNHGDFLEILYQDTKKIMGYLRRVRPDNAKYCELPTLNFDKLRNYPIDPNFKSEYLAVLAFIQQLEQIYDQLKSLHDKKKSFNRPVLTHDFYVKGSLRGIWIQFRSQLTFESHHFRHALRGALCLSVGLFCVRWWHLEFGFWTLMTSLLVLRPNLSTTWTRVLQRIAGTICGLILVATLLKLGIASIWLPWLFALGAILFFHTSTKQYGFAVFCVTLFVFSAFALNGEGQLIVLPRLENTLLGVALPVIFVLLIVPGWQRHSFPIQLRSTIVSYRDYILALLNEPTDNTSIKLSFQSCVRHDCNLFDHWLAYLGEPKKNEMVSEEILLCCRYSNLILGWITHIQHHDSVLTDEVKTELMNCVHCLALIEKSLKEAETNFFEVITQNEKKIYLALSRLTQQQNDLSLLSSVQSLETVLMDVLKN